MVLLLRAFWHWFTRTSPIMVLLFFWAGAIVLLVSLRADPNFGAISALLGVVIGGLTTALVQTSLETRTSIIKQDESAQKRFEDTWEQRVRDVKNMMEGTILVTLNGLDDLAQVRIASMVPNNADERQKRYDYYLQRRDSRDRVVDVRGRSMVVTIGNAQLIAQLATLDKICNDAIAKGGNTNTTTNEYAQFRVDTENSMYRVLADVYTALNRIQEDEVASERFFSILR
jgi:hypothetical protein